MCLSSKHCSHSFSFNRSQLLDSQKNDWTFCAAEHSEIWQFASQLDGHLTEVEDWDLGAGIYIDFLTLKNSFVDTLGPIEELVWCLMSSVITCLPTIFVSVVWYIVFSSLFISRVASVVAKLGYL